MQFTSIQNSQIMQRDVFNDEKTSWQERYYQKKNPISILNTAVFVG